MLPLYNETTGGVNSSESSSTRSDNTTLSSPLYLGRQVSAQKTIESSFPPVDTSESSKESTSLERKVAHHSSITTLDHLKDGQLGRQLPGSIASPTSSSSFVAGAGMTPTDLSMPGSSSGDSVAMKPPFDDDDDFYFLCKKGNSSAGGIKQEGIDFLTKNNPGIFDDFDEKSLKNVMGSDYRIRELFYRDPVKYQPIARYFAQGYEGNLFAALMRYGEYKGNFYDIEEDYEGAEKLIVASDLYEFMKAHGNLEKESKQFVSQLQELLFDQSVSNDYKVTKLQALFFPINQGEDVSIGQLCEKMDLLFGNAFTQAQQRAINSGFKP